MSTGKSSLSFSDRFLVHVNLYPKGDVPSSMIYLCNVRGILWPWKFQAHVPVCGGLFLCNHDLFDPVALADIIDHLQSFNDFPKTGMVAIEMCGISAAVTNEKL